MWLTILKDIQLRIECQEKLNFCLDRISHFRNHNFKLTHFNRVGA